MNWDAIGAIAETLGAVGVIATLAYLAVQIRQNTSTVRSSAAASIAQSNNTVQLMLAQDADVNRLWWVGLADPNALSEADSLRFNNVVSVAVNASQQAHAQFLEGAITEKGYSGQREFIIWVANQPGFIAYWADWSSMYEPEFAQLVAAAIPQISRMAQSATADSA